MSHVLQQLAHAQARIGDLNRAETLGDISSSVWQVPRNQTIAQIIGTRLDAADLVGPARLASSFPMTKTHT